MEGLFPPVDPEAERGRPRRRLVPFTAVLPNLVTLLGLCAGLAAIRMAVEHRFDIAVAAIILAVILDGVDGRLARYFRSTSKFGEQLNSLADFVNFGVAPALLLYVWRLDDLRSFGWICAMVLAICTGLRLARFNAALTAAEPRPDWHRDFFVGIPAPAGAVAGAAALLPGARRLALCARRSRGGGGLCADHRAPHGEPHADAVGQADRPAHPARQGHARAGARHMLVALLASYPFSFLAVGTIAYLAHLPFAWRAWNRADAKGAMQAPAEGGESPG